MNLSFRFIALFALINSLDKKLGFIVENESIIPCLTTLQAKLLSMVNAPPNFHILLGATIHYSTGSDPSLPCEPCNSIAGKISNILISDGCDDVVHSPSAEFASSPACNSFLLGFHKL